MPTTKVNGVNIHYEIIGQGKQTIVFSHGLLWSGEMFSAQVAYFKENYTCVIYDHRGQGRSEVTEDGYDMDNITQDAIALIESLQLAPCHFVGLSMGGFVGMRIGARRPDLLKSLMLLETSADPEPNKLKYNIMTLIFKVFGIKALSKKIMQIMFGKTFLNDPKRSLLRQEWQKRLESNAKTITKAVRGVIDRNSVIDEIQKITLPTLVLVGDEDLATVPEKAKRIHQQISSSQLIIIKNAGHSSCIEEADVVNKSIENFLANI
jgi:pimeloyl-ACP methyl ester carboxylesterase